MTIFLKRRTRTLFSLAVVSGLILSTLVSTLAVSAGSASASSRRPLCVGTTQSPGVLAGKYRSGVKIEGVCAVNGDPTVVHGELTLAPGSALVAAFALNDLTGKGVSKLTVLGGITVGNGATLILGCDASSFLCVDDPSQSAPTLSSPAVLGGNLNEDQALGVIMHDATINGNLRQTGGSGV